LLPDGYDDPSNWNRRYPVLYLNDGQNVFDATTSLFNPMEWRADESVNKLIRDKKIEPMILVGIDNAGRHMRFNEYFPYEDKYLDPPIPSPQGKKYPDFLVDEVLPMINAAYRTRTGRESTGIGGSSAGAVAALQAVISRPVDFGYLLMESPSLYISDGQLLRDAAAIKTMPIRAYIGVGTNEEGQSECKPGDINRQAVTDVLTLKQVFVNAGMGDDRLKVLVEDCTLHNEDAWAKRFPVAIEFLFKRTEKELR
jgi:pullulanase